MKPEQLTELLNSDHKDLNTQQQQVLNQVYAQLKKIAKSQRYKIQQNELNTTALVNEAWIKLNKNDFQFNDRGHFFAVSALAMRQILLNQAKKIQQRGHHEEINEDLMVGDMQQAHWLLDLEQQLNNLAEYSSRLEKIFIYRFFGGMGVKEVAELFNVSERTINREWKKAKLMISIGLEQDV